MHTTILHYALVHLFISSLGSGTTVAAEAKEAKEIKDIKEPKEPKALNEVKGEPCTHDDTNLRCVDYSRNYDGDTITFNIKNVPAIIGKDIGIRVLGIDTPEIKARDYCEKKAAVIARDLIHDELSKAKRIDLINIERDKYFRILADVMYDGKSVKDLLLARSLAYPYRGQTKKKMDWCIGLKKQEGIVVKKP